MYIKFRELIPLLLSFMILFSSCEDDEEPEQNNLRPGALIANFNGQSIDFAYFADAGDIEVSGGTLTGIYINGETENFSKSLAIALMPFSGTGQYVIDGLTTEEEMDSFNYWTSPPEGGIVTGYSTLDGLIMEVNITYFDGEVLKGTFSGGIKCTDCNGNVELITIADGTIDVEYTGDFY